MNLDKESVLKFVEENDVKFVRLAFCDIFGVMKNVAIMAEQLPYVLENGSGFDVSVLPGFLNVAESDLLLFPDPSSLSILPWRPGTGRVARMYCDIRSPDGQPFVGCGRHLLRKTVRKATREGLTLRIGTECEFYLFEMNEMGLPTLHPQDKAGYLDVAPLDKGENVRRDICLALEEMGLYPQGSHHEKGPGQNEIWCSATDPLRAADNFITYKSVVRTIAANYGLFACFMPKPLADKSGNGLHLNFTMNHDGKAVGAQDEMLEYFMAGILEHASEITMFMNTTTNSYHRFGAFDAPKYISWSRGNRAQLLRAPERKGAHGKLELRSPDPLCNPYLVFTLLLEAGLKGIAAGKPLPPPADFNIVTAEESVRSGYSLLPQTLHQALECTMQGDFVQQILPPQILTKVIEYKQQEWQRYLAEADKVRFEHSLYFEMT